MKWVLFLTLISNNGKVHMEFEYPNKYQCLVNKKRITYIWREVKATKSECKRMKVK